MGTFKGHGHLDDNANFAQPDGSNPTFLGSDHKSFDNPRWGEFHRWFPECYYSWDGDGNDEGPRGINGTFSGSTAPSIDSSVKKLGAASLKGGAGGVVQLDSLAQDTIRMDDKSWSIMFWYKVSANPDALIDLVIRWVPGAWAAGGKAIEVGTDGNITWQAHGSPGVNLATSVCDDTWRHIAIVRDAKDGDQEVNEFEVWNNGVSAGMHAVDIASINYTDDVELMDMGASETKTAHMDDFIYFTYPVSESYIQACYNGGTGAAANTAGLV